MENDFLNIFFSSIVTNTLGFGYMYILIDSWKIFGKKRFLAVVTYIAITILVDGLILHFVGTADTIAMGMALLNCIMGLIFILLVSKFKNGAILFVYFSGLMFVFITNNIANVLTKSNSLSFILMKIVSDLVFISIIYKYMRPKFFEFTETFKSGWYILTGLPVSLCLSFTFLVNSNQMLYEDIYVKINCILLSITAIIAYTFIYFTMGNVIEREKIKDSQRVMELELFHVEKYIEGLMEERRKASVFNHDLRHYANLISACVQNDDKDGINDALNHIYKDIDEVTASKSKKYCDNPTINTIMAYFAIRAEESYIDFDTLLDIENELEIEKMDLAILLSNCIENAINACQKIKSTDRKIKVIAKKLGRQLFITVENTKEGKVLFDEAENLPISIIEGHGIGSKSIKAFVEKYDGQIVYEIDENIFKIKILI